MTILALDSNNDLFRNGSAIARHYNGNEVLQMVRSRLLTYFGEWVFDTTAGTTYLQEIFVRPANLGVTESIIKSRISGTTVMTDTGETEGVQEIISFTLDFNRTTRRLSIEFEARTTFGELIGDTLFINT